MGVRGQRGNEPDFADTEGAAAGAALRSPTAERPIAPCGRDIAAGDGRRGNAGDHARLGFAYRGHSQRISPPANSARARARVL